MQGQTDAVVGNASLRIVVGTDTLAAVACSYLTLAVLGSSGTLLLLRLLQNTRTQYTHTFFTVLQLRFFILTLCHNTCRNVGNTHCRFGFVYVLAAGTACTVGIDTQVCRIDFYINLFSLRQYSHCNGRGVYASLGFCFRHALYTMYAAFEFHTAVNAVAADLEYYFLKAAQLSRVGIHNLNAPATGFCIAQIHTEENTGKKCSLITAGTAADFHDNVFIIVRVGRQQKNRELFLIFFNLRFELLQLFFCHFNQLFVIACCEQLLCLIASLNHIAIFTVSGNNRFQLGMRFGSLQPVGLVGNNLGVTDFCL